MNHSPGGDRRFLTRYAWLSIAAALATIALKSGAYVLTDSVGLLSDAVESLVNLTGAVMALAMLILAARRPNDDYNYGYSKAEYFSSLLEGSLILVAAAAICAAAVPRLLDPQPLEQVGLGLGVSVLASLINFGVAMVLMRAGERHHSITLEADARHLFSDVWTSAGILAGVALVSITQWHVLDPLVAMMVALHIAWAGAGLVRRSAAGLMDKALPAAEQAALQRVLDSHKEGAHFHALRTRRSGARRFISMHVLVPGQWTVLRGHQLLEHIEADIRAALPNVTVITHLEPLEDPASWDDHGLDHVPPAGAAASPAADKT